DGLKTPAGHARENLRSTTSQRVRGTEHGNRPCVKKSRTAAREGVRFSLRRRRTFGASTHEWSARSLYDHRSTRIHQEMTKRGSLTLSALLVLPGLLFGADIVAFPSGELTLHGVLYKPEGTGPFPAV